MKMKSCCVPACIDRVSKRHRFPKSNPSLFKTWIGVVQPANWEDLTVEQIYNRFYVCHAHFTKNYHLPGSKRGLTIDAVPTIGVPSTRDSFDSVLPTNELKFPEAVETLEKCSEARPCASEISTPEKEEDGCDEVMELDTQESFCDSLRSKEQKQIGVKKTVLRRSQLTAKEKVMYSMIKEYNARLTQLKNQNRRLRQRLAHAEKLISSGGFQHNLCGRCLETLTPKICES